MLTEINALTKQLFQKENLDNTSTEELEGFIGKYPYSASARLLLASKQQDNQATLLTASLYLTNPLRLNWLLENCTLELNEISFEPGSLPQGLAAEQKEVSVTREQRMEDAPKDKPIEEPLAFQSYHTIDYFASQGIRLQLADLGKDKLGQQLKSFTEWLRSMKKLPTSETLTPPTEDGQVARTAASSIEEKEVVTEAMAEVWLKQGNREKAHSIYSKLSLQNPDKSAYFAAKIDQLK